MHKFGMCHGDFKLDNLLLTEGGTIKITDFGLSRLAVETSSFQGTPGYIAPEVYTRTPYDPKQVDLFGVVVIIFIMVMGRPPFAQARVSDRHYRYIYAHDWDGFWSSQSPVAHPELKDLVEKMLRADPNERLSLN
jgi:serine/threonine protein kinase